MNPSSWTAKLYASVPPPIRKLYRRIEKESEMRKRKRFTKEWRNLEEILADPKSTEQEKRLARMELVAREDPEVRVRASEMED